MTREQALEIAVRRAIPATLKCYVIWTNEGKPPQEYELARDAGFFGDKIRRIFKQTMPEPKNTRRVL